LRADRHQVQFVPTSDHILDMLTFRRLLGEVRAHSHDAPERCDACVARLVEVAELYQGDFLAGFSLSDSAPFEEWATIQRQQLHQQALDVLDTLLAFSTDGTILAGGTIESFVCGILTAAG
jgi:hypothetical protein